MELQSKQVCLEKREGIHIIIDYFSSTFPFICYEEDSEYRIINEIIMMICEFYCIYEKYIEKCDYLMHRFECQHKLSEHITLRLLGSERKAGYKSCQIELSGQGCREWENLSIDKTWINFLEFFVLEI